VYLEISLHIWGSELDSKVEWKRRRGRIHVLF